MKKYNYLLLGVTGACFAIGVGYSSLFAKEVPLKSLAIKQKNLLTQSLVNPNVNEYLEQNKPESYKTLKNNLDVAIQDAKIPSQNKVVNNLWSLSTSNSRIQTRTKNSKTEFLMVTWKYVKNPNKDWQPGLKRIEYQTWLTASPQVKEFCSNCKGSGIKIPNNIMLSLRLQQYLGLILNSNSNKTHFIEMWVKAEDLSRPCIDPEINDTTCNVLPVPVPVSNSVVKKIYKDSYEDDTKEHYPWTGLGYTYDWGIPQKPHIGASEFIINPTPEKPVEVEVVSITATKEYCNNQYLK